MPKLNPYQRYLAEMEKIAKGQNTPAAPVTPKTPAEAPAEKADTTIDATPSNVAPTPNKFKV